MRAFADAISTGDLTGAIDRDPDPVHCLAYGYPQPTSRFAAQRAECGVHVPLSQVAAHVDDVTCSRCRRILEVREETTI